MTDDGVTQYWFDRACEQIERDREMFLPFTPLTWAEQNAQCAKCAWSAESWLVVADGFCRSYGIADEGRAAFRYPSEAREEIKRLREEAKCPEWWW